jgi:hypothetical protein
MRVRSEERLFLLGTALLLSVAAHLLLYRLLIVTFAPFPEAFKPPMTFLGSLLAMQDVSPRNSKNSSSTKPGIFPFPISTQESEFLTRLTNSTKKPQVTKGVAPVDKATEKMSFLSFQPESQNEQSLKNEFGIDSKAPDYVPLKLYPLP